MADPLPQYLPCGIGIHLRDIHVSTRVLDLLKCSTVRIEGIIQHAQSVAASAGEYLNARQAVVETRRQDTPAGRQRIDSG